MGAYGLPVYIASETGQNGRSKIRTIILIDCWGIMTAVSTTKKKQDSISIVAPNDREPRQDRSRASYERMLTAAEKLMVKRGDDEFTLTEVAKKGKASIGSIYLRFKGKDELIGAVHVRVLARINEDNEKMLAELAKNAIDLDTCTRLFVERFAELLKAHSPILRPIMLRAAHDESMSQIGRSFADRLSAGVNAQLLKFANEFGRPDARRLVENVYRMVYCTLARYLGLGSSPEAANEGNWEELKEDLAIMCAAFLRAR